MDSKIRVSEFRGAISCRGPGYELCNFCFWANVFHSMPPQHRTPEPPTANNNQHHNHGRRWRKWFPSANTPRRRIRKSAAGTTGCENITISHEIGQRRQTRGDERRRRRMREGDGGGLEATKAEARGGPPGGRREAMTASVVDERCVVGRQEA